MDRLTFKDKNGIYIILENKEQEKYYFNNDYVMLNFYYSKKIIEKLAEFEDFMEKHNIEDLQELECRVVSEVQITDIVLNQSREIDNLTNKWDKLKECVSKSCELNFKYNRMEKFEECKTIEAIMQMLEKDI